MPQRAPAKPKPADKRARTVPKRSRPAVLKSPSDAENQAVQSVAPKTAAKPKRERSIKVTVMVGRCPHGACDSTRRTGYQHVRERELSGLIDGRPYTHIVWKRTTCGDCGKPRVEIHYENRPAGR